MSAHHKVIAPARRAAVIMLITVRGRVMRLETLLNSLLFDLPSLAHGMVAHEAIDGAFRVARFAKSDRSHVVKGKDEKQELILKHIADDFRLSGIHHWTVHPFQRVESYLLTFQVRPLCC